MYAPRLTRRVLLFALFAVCLAVAVPSLAHAAGTGDDPRLTADVLTAAEAKAKAVKDARFDQWLDASGGYKPVTPSRVAAGSVTAQAVYGPPPQYAYLWTPDHRQERTYWCAPATCQIVDHFHYNYMAQYVYAGFMGTTTDGTDFSKVDDCLRYYTGVGYYYYGPIASWSVFMNHIMWAVGSDHHPCVADIAIDPYYMRPYVFAHSGHVLPIEAYDTRWDSLRVNDPYNEATWRSGGGSTGGHVLYNTHNFYHGIQTHFRHAVIR